jgi:hypothetical protein
MLRVVAHETGRWVANEQARAELPELIKQPACTGDRRWDALVEGVTAYRMNLAGLEPPQWTERTSLDEGWNPYDDSETPPPPQWALLDTFDTPAELLAKGVTYSRRNMALL